MVPHAVVASGVVALPAGLSLSGVFRGTSGTFFSAAGGLRDYDGDGIASSRPEGTTRNQFRGPNAFNDRPPAREALHVRPLYGVGAGRGVQPVQRAQSPADRQHLHGGGSDSHVRHGPLSRSQAARRRSASGSYSRPGTPSLPGRARQSAKAREY